MLYKYLSKNSVEVIKNLVIRFSPLRSLNDPFESRPIIDLSEKFSDFTEKAIKEFQSETVYDDDGNVVTLADAKKLLANIIEEDHYQIYPSALGYELITTIGDSFGVLCVTRTKSSLLMWSHYASEGQGYLLALDSRHEFFHQKSPNGLMAGPRPVRYTTERQRIRPDDDDYYEKLFCIKPLEWSYEEEERVFRNYSPEAPVEEHLDSYGQKVRLSRLPADAILGVYFGYNSEQKLIDEISDLILQNEIECPLYKGSISEHEYKVIFEEIIT